MYFMSLFHHRTVFDHPIFKKLFHHIQLTADVRRSILSLKSIPQRFASWQPVTQQSAAAAADCDACDFDSHQAGEASSSIDIVSLQQLADDCYWIPADLNTSKC
jgi:hypothetical protein